MFCRLKCHILDLFLCGQLFFNVDASVLMYSCIYEINSHVFCHSYFDSCCFINQKRLNKKSVSLAGIFSKF